MAPIRFDKDIKEKLEKRTIRPSENTWERLSERLDANEENRNSKNYWWLGIAASVIGLLFIVVQFFNEPKTESVQPQVVNTPEVINNEHRSLENNLPIKVIPEITEIKQEVAEVDKKEQEKEKLSVEKNTVIIEVEPTLAVNKEIAPEKIDPSSKTEKILKEDITFEEQKIQEVVAQVKELQENKSQVTDAEIEKLLQQAQQEIALKKIYNKSTGVVDANALLQDVEEDLDRSFRTRVFEALKASYGTVKTAVANRNN